MTPVLRSCNGTKAIGRTFSHFRPTLTTSTVPSYLLASFSISGATILQGVHQVAQKSTTTGFSLLRTSSSNVAIGGFDDGHRWSFLRERGGWLPLVGERPDEAIGLEDAWVTQAIQHGAAIATCAHKAR